MRRERWDFTANDRLTGSFCLYSVYDILTIVAGPAMPGEANILYQQANDTSSFQKNV